MWHLPLAHWVDSHRCEDWGTEGTGIEEPKAPKGWGVERRCPFPDGEGAVLPPQKFFDFWAQKGEFWCILSVIFCSWLTWMETGMHWVACTDWWVLVTFWSHLKFKCYVHDVHQIKSNLFAQTYHMCKVVKSVYENSTYSDPKTVDKAIIE